MLEAPWRIQMLGELRVSLGARRITRFQTRKTGLLLAYLALKQTQNHPREELIELFWPDAEPDAGRTSLRTALASLRRQLEPPGIPRSVVLQADRARARVNPAAVTTDVADFESALESASQALEDADRIAALESAAEVYRGDLLPGYYDDWIETERNRLAESYIGALRRLVRDLAKSRALDRAIEYARRSVAADPLREESQRDLIGLYAATGNHSAAMQQYQDLERRLQAELGVPPAARTRELAEQVSRSLGHGVATIRREESFHAHYEGDEPEQAPARPGRLPVQLTRFFGREDELRRLAELLESSRLITLSGPGGSGKTRLAVEVARKVSDSFGGLVWFVSLADISDARLIPGALLDSLRLRRRPAVEPLAQAEEMIGAQPALVILDNFEQVAAGGAPFVQRMLERIPSLRCLVTSRRRLAVAGEREFPVRPLPAPDAPASPEELMGFASVQLFSDRAQAMRPDFQVTSGNAGAVAELCRALEGIPLAIELAAARAQSMTPSHMLERLAQRFELLATRRTDKDSRHRSLWAAIDWSHHLLTPELQRLFGCLSVFRGGWTAEAVEAVCEQPAALEYLAQLRERSLILSEEREGELRFRMLDSIREYAVEQIGESERLEIADRHAAFFLNLAESAEPELQGPSAREWLERLEAEHDNLRAAQDRALESGDVEGSLRFAGSLWRFLYMRGHAVEGYDRCTKALDLAVGSLALRARALGGAGILANANSRFTDATEHWNEALRIHREMDNPDGIVAMLSNLGVVAYDRGHYESARMLYEEGLSIVRRLGNRWRTAILLNNLGNAIGAMGELERAQPLLEESLGIRRELGDSAGIASTLGNLGSFAYAGGDYARARSFQEESLAIRRELGNKPGIVTTLYLLAAAACKLGDLAAAGEAYGEGIALAQEIGNRIAVVCTLEGMCSLAITQERFKRAAVLAGAAAALRRAIASPMPMISQADHERGMELLRSNLSEEAFTAAWNRGQSMSLAEAVEFALR